MQRAWVLFACALALTAGELETARDRQDQAALARLADQAVSRAQQQNNADAFYQAALAKSFQAEVAMEKRDKRLAKDAAEAGITAARKAVELNGKQAEYHRVLGTLCGQVIPANLFSALTYGKCAQESVNKAIELNPKSALAYVSRGVGNYYLPEQMGGGASVALKDFEQARKLDPKLAEAWLWTGVALRKANRNSEARQALQQAVTLAPQRAWAKEQLEKTPAK